MRMTLGPDGRVLGASLEGPARRLMTRTQEMEAEKLELDAPLVGQFEAGDRVTVLPAWKRHWSFLNAPAPTRRLWAGLVDQEGTVESTDRFGNVYVLDRFAMLAGGGGFPVPARFVRKTGG